MRYLVQELNVNQQLMIRDYVSCFGSEGDPIKDFYFFKGRYFSKHYRDYVDCYNQGNLEKWMAKENKAMERCFSRWAYKQLKDRVEDCSLLGDQA